MKNHFLITGMRGSGKSWKARKMLSLYDSDAIVSFSGRILYHTLVACVTKATKVLFITEIINEFEAEKVIELMKNGLKVRYAGKPTVILSPEIICICQSDDKPVLDVFLKEQNNLFSLIDMDEAFIKNNFSHPPILKTTQ